MRGRITVACVIGTRPEVIKMAPVIRELRKPGSRFAVELVSTGQHRELLDQALADFQLNADHDLGLMRPVQDVAELAGRSVCALGELFAKGRPDLVLVQGDTTTAFAAALAAHLQRIIVGHVEAGLRSGDRRAPFPEETNRSLISQVADLHFAPTAESRNNLLRAGIDPATIHLTGNTVIDALLWTARRSLPLPIELATKKFMLVTAHRRENWGEPLGRVCEALKRLVAKHTDVSVVFPLHPNPLVRIPIERGLGGIDRIHLLGPVSYPSFVSLLKHCHLVVTDSGGVQEEAPALGKPVLVMREATERPEALSAGAARLVGTDPSAIVAAADRLLTDPLAYADAARSVYPFGDGTAARRIVEVLADRFRERHETNAREVA